MPAAAGLRSLKTQLFAQKVGTFGSNIFRFAIATHKPAPYLHNLRTKPFFLPLVYACDFTSAGILL